MNRRQILSLSAIAALGLRLLPAAVVGGAAQAAPTIIDGMYEETSNVTSMHIPPTPEPCTNSTDCIIVFSRVPQGKRLIVTRVSCSVNISAGALHWVRIFGVRPNDAFIKTSQTMLPTATTVSTRFLVNQETLQLFNERDRPLIGLAGTQLANTSGFCTIAGRLVVLP